MNAMEDHLLKLRPFPLADIGQVVSFLKDFLNAWYVQSVILCLAFYAFTPLPLLAQEETLSEKIISMVEELTGEDTEGGEAVLYQEKLHELMEDGVKINSADEQEISRLFFLSAFQVRALADYIKRTGKILSHYEIANIPGFDRETAEMMMPFIRLDNKIVANENNSKCRSTLLTNISVKPSGYEQDAPGSPWKILARYRFLSGQISGGVTTEKDSGEKFFSWKPPEVEYISAHLAYSGSGFFKKIICGDYSARFGLGTNINSSIMSGISVTAPINLPSNDEIKPYTSSDENNFFRGIAAQLQIGKSTISGFYSMNMIDGKIKADTGIVPDHCLTLYKTGLHTSFSSLSGKDAVGETSWGFSFSGTYGNLRAGMLFSENRFSLPMKNPDSGPEHIFEFEGDNNRLLSFYYNAVIKRLHISGEYTFNLINRSAFVQSITARPADRLSVSLIYRVYEPGYTAFHGKGPFCSSSGDNVSGIAGSVTFEASKYIFISAGCDLRHNKWLKYRCSAPSVSVNEEVRIKYLPPGKTSAELVYNYRRFSQNGQNSPGIISQEIISVHTGRITLKYSPEENLSLGNRIEYKTLPLSGNHGILIFQDLNIRLSTIPLTILMRYCIFNTDNWNSRIYTYENDLLYGFSIPALSGMGSRSYIMGKLKINLNTELRLKYGMTYRHGICDSEKFSDEIKMQLRMSF